MVSLFATEGWRERRGWEEEEGEKKCQCYDETAIP